MSDFSRTYFIGDYGRKAPFSSFLPGVAGETGIPLWCFYVNRGQAIAGFGSRDKQHSIMEFCPANTAYQRVQTNGFRTFLRLNNQFVEPFANGLGGMYISENMLTIHWESDVLRMEADYFIVPGLPIGMLARRVRLTNLSAQPAAVEILDGLASIVPYGLSQHDLKMMGQTAKAWMMVEGTEDSLPYFRLRSSLVDTTSVQAIEDGSFGAAAAKGTLLPPIVDPTAVFGWDTAFTHPVCFSESGLPAVLNARQRIENELPCCFFAWQGMLAAGETLKIDSLYGLSHGQAFHPWADQLLCQNGLDMLQKQAETLLDPYAKVIETHTADALFDRYCRQSYIDNFLRGGVPHLFRNGDQKQLFYLFSRKHGDLERDYNDFVVTPEYASQGNGNYRDVLQNRRSDVRFHPEAGIAPLKPFLELIQSDGYNPLILQPASFEWPVDISLPQALQTAGIKELLSAPFTPGSLLMTLENVGFNKEECRRYASEILCSANPVVNAAFGEGYWVDHWVYLLDFLESYLSVYPENLQTILNERCLRWYESRASVRPLHERCILQDGQLRQHNALDESAKRSVDHEWLQDSEGSTILSTMLEKLFMLCCLKFASLDHTGEAVSMEAGKPGWYDALNGLPGLFGSSTAESCELWRTLHFLHNCMKDQNVALQLPSQMLAFACEMARIAQLEEPMLRWQQATSCLEHYRAETLYCLKAEKAILSVTEAVSIISALENCVSKSVLDLIERTEGAVPTYFVNLPEAWREKSGGIYPTAFSHRPLPLFLEGPMHALRLPISQETKLQITQKIHSSALYDDKLKMYKVSSDLSRETPELGRANAFTRGWLEHESIWLHMEYKYLLELLKNGFYDAFFRDFENALIPFQPAQRYGRSLLENSSFLASSANPDPDTHGRGFVARLSGATAEFLDMWQRMFFGSQPFASGGDGLYLSLCPVLPRRLIPDDGIVSAVFLGSTQIIYHLPCENITPATHKPVRYVLDGRAFESDVLGHQEALDVRKGRISTIEVTIGRR